MATPEQQARTRMLNRINGMQFQPVTQLPMTVFMLWMSGNDIHIFSIMMTGMAIYQPFNSLIGTNTAFKMFENDKTIASDVFRGKLVYAACCCVALLVGLVKLSWMGLLPTSASDWMEHAYNAAMLK